MTGLRNNMSDDELLNDARRLIIERQRASTSMLQRRFRIGYRRASRIITALEAEGAIGPCHPTEPRKVLTGATE